MNNITTINAATRYLAQRGALTKLATPIKTIGSDSMITSRIVHAIQSRRGPKRRAVVVTVPANYQHFALAK